MAKRISFGRSASNVLFWSLVSAAFIGPGTVTVAASAGASFHLSLLWALFFSTIATIVLQEAAARITIASGKSLGEIISLKYPNESGDSIKTILFLSVAFGCAAYQAGNLLGAMAGISLLTDINPKIILPIIGLVCASILFLGNIKVIARTLGIVVALMGLLFIYVALQTDVPFYDVLESTLLPTFPENSLLLIISLIGTTIVPYNLFLASGISRGQSISEMRWGVSIAVLLGGLFSMAILIVGTQISGTFSFDNLANALAERSVKWTGTLFAFGLFAAGISSSITAPLAAAITAQSMYQKSQGEWSPKSLYFRLVWAIVIGVGLLFSLLDIKPIPAIIMAQAINGILLPVIAIFLLLVVNDIRLFPDGYTNTIFSNILMLIVVGTACFLGLYNIFKAFSSTIAVPITPQQATIGVSVLTATILLFVVWRIFISKK